MVRQKVKGTGHKQPADAQTEPNFYALPPTTGSATSSPAAVPLAPLSPPPRPTSPPMMMAAPKPNLMDEMSPGTRGVHGAASLLKGIAAGVAPSKLKSINPNSAVPFLGPPAEKPFDGSQTQAVGSPITAATQSLTMQSTYRLDEKEEQPNNDLSREQDRSSFSSSPPPKSSYSSLLWGGGAPAPSPPATAPLAPAMEPPAAFLWPQANQARARTESGEGEKKGQDPEEQKEVGV